MSTEINSASHLNFNSFVKAGRDIYPKKSIGSLTRRLFFYLKIKKHNALISDFFNKINSLSYSHILQHQPYVLGNLVWPYIHKEWDVAQRFTRIAEHYAILKGMPKFLDVSDKKPKQIISLGTYAANVALVLDKPQWFAREGEIVLNIFQDDLRVMSIAFSLAKQQNQIVLYVGAIQGIHNGVSSDKSLEIIRQLTKDFHGFRPRSLIIDILRMIAVSIGATKILAVNQANRHHKHRYFKSKDCLKHSDYDEIWQEHEGVPADDGFYLLKTSTKRKDLTEIESKKRSQYRKRYAMLDDIASKISQLN